MSDDGLSLKDFLVSILPFGEILAFGSLLGHLFSITEAKGSNIFLFIAGYILIHLAIYLGWKLIKRTL